MALGGRGQCSVGGQITATTARLGKPMLRLTAIFIAVCVALIAASLGAVVYLLLGLSAAELAIVALAVLVTLTIYNTVSSRVRDRSDIGDQIADLSRGTADLARQVGELARKVVAFENDAGNLERRVKTAIGPLSSEIGELGALVKNLAEAVAAQEVRLATPASAARSPLAEPVLPGQTRTAMPEEAREREVMADVKAAPSGTALRAARSRGKAARRLLRSSARRSMPTASICICSRS